MFRWDCPRYLPECGDDVWFIGGIAVQINQTLVYCSSKGFCVYAPCGDKSCCTVALDYCCYIVFLLMKTSILTTSLVRSEWKALSTRNFLRPLKNDTLGVNLLPACLVSRWHPLAAFQLFRSSWECGRFTSSRVALSFILWSGSEQWAMKNPSEILPSNGLSNHETQARKSLLYGSIARTSND